MAVPRSFLSRTFERIRKMEEDDDEKDLDGDNSGKKIRATKLPRILDASSPLPAAIKRDPDSRAEIFLVSLSFFLRRERFPPDVEIGPCAKLESTEEWRNPDLAKRFIDLWQTNKTTRC